MLARRLLPLFWTHCQLGPGRPVPAQSAIASCLAFLFCAPDLVDGKGAGTPGNSGLSD